MLLDVPAEILLEVIALLDRHDVKNLSEVSSSLWRIATPILYRSIILRDIHEDKPERLDVTSLRWARYSEKNLFRYTDEVIVKSCFPTRSLHCCPHEKIANFWGDGGNTSSALDDHPTMAELGSDLVEIFLGLQDNTLKSFKWELGTCVPSGILGPSGYMALRQLNLESIRLEMDAACDWKRHFGSPVVLSHWKNLEKFAWTGLQPNRDCEALHDALLSVSSQLTHLELRLEEVPQSTESYDHELFSLRPFTLQKFSLSTLNVLLLSGISFSEHVSCEVPNMFNLKSLQSLRLHMCRGWDVFLACYQESCSPIQLKMLDIKENEERVGRSDPSLGGNRRLEASKRLSSFLGSFEGLQKLHLKFAFPVDFSRVGLSVVQHQSSLREFFHNLPIIKPVTEFDQK